MNIPFSLTEEERAELERAKEERRYDLLSSWKLLFLFQVFLATNKQRQEISSWARKKRNGEFVYVPLAKNTTLFLDEAGSTFV